MHHNEKDGQIIGRVHSVEYTEVNTRGNTPALIFTANVGDEEGKKGIKNGTLSTVSIGVIAHDLRCSICGTNLAEEGLCEHEKGEYYDVEGEQRLCYWIIEKMEPKEVSYVIVPSDAYAHNLRVYDAVKKKKSEVKESVEFNNPFAELIEATKVKVEDAKEGKQIDEEVGKTADVNKSEEKPEDKAIENENIEGQTQEPNTEENKEQETDKETSKEEEKETSEEEKQEEPKKEEASKEDSEELKLAKEKIAQLEKELEDTKAEKAKLENKLEKVKETKESVEKELVKLKAEKKKQLVETISELRSQLSLPKEDETALMESSEESLQLTIKSLNEFTQVQKTAFGLQTLNSPVAVSESKDNTTVEKTNKKTDVKESIDKSNKTLEDKIINLMENLF